MHVILVRLVLMWGPAGLSTEPLFYTVYTVCPVCSYFDIYFSIIFFSILDLYCIVSGVFHCTVTKEFPLRGINNVFLSTYLSIITGTNHVKANIVYVSDSMFYN